MVYNSFEREIRIALIETIGEKDAEYIISKIFNDRSRDLVKIVVDEIYNLFGYQQGRKVILALAYNLQRKNSHLSKLFLSYLK